MNSVKKEMRLFAIAGAVIVLNVGAHLLGAKIFVNAPMTEITLASVPFLMLFLGWLGVRIAAKD
jgi:hypothetical protein